MMCNRKVLVCGIIFTQIGIAIAELISTLTGSNVQLNCSYTVPIDGIAIQWVITGNSRIELSYNDQLFTHNGIPTEFRERINITGNHANGEYSLMISGVKKTDHRQYECFVYGAFKSQKQELVVIDPPTLVEIQNKQNNMLHGTEGLDLNISCAAIGGDLAPNMTLLIGLQIIMGQNRYSIEKRITNINRSYDNITISCKAEYSDFANSLKIDTATIRLNLKPLPPSFSKNPVVTENTKLLVLTCLSLGSRPAPSNVIWLIGDNNVDITSYASNVNVSKQSDDTYTVSSTLTYKVPKQYNQKNLICGLKNNVSVTYIQSATKVNVFFAPSVNVGNTTFKPSDVLRQMACFANGNPSNYTYYKWQHKSKYNVVIRELEGNSTLTLPQVSVDVRYQDTGEYVCTVSNGIEDMDGKINQQASGYLVSRASPVIISGTQQSVSANIESGVILQVKLYSEPKYDMLRWIKGGLPISQSTKYTMAEVPVVLTDTFHGTKIQIDGYRVTLTIHDLMVEDFTNYTLQLGNGVGEIVEHVIILSLADLSCNENSNRLIGVVVGLSTLTVVSLLCNAILTYRMMNGNACTTTKKKSLKYQTNRTSNLEVYYNTAGIVNDKDTVGEETIESYEELGLKDRPNEYEELKPNAEASASEVVDVSSRYETLGTTETLSAYDDLEEIKDS